MAARFAALMRALANLAALLLFVIGVMLTYEVTARYFFNAPTVWAEELSRVFMIWAVFIGSSALIASDDHIRVTVITDLLPASLQRLAKVVSLVFVAVIAAFVAWNGVPIAQNSFDAGRTTGSMLDLPSWWIQAAVPVGFVLMAVQALLLAASMIAGGAGRVGQPVDEIEV